MSGFDCRVKGGRSPAQRTLDAGIEPGMLEMADSGRMTDASKRKPGYADIDADFKELETGV